MMEWFSLLQAANPTALWAGLLIPFLILAYLRKRSKRMRTVSSVVILENLSRKRLLRKRFRPPLRFFLEILALLALLGAATLPSLKDTSARIALIIDNSLSMRALSQNGKTRALDAQAAAVSWLKHSSETGRFSVFSSSPKLKKVGTGLVSSNEAINLLDKISPSYCSDSLDISLAEVARSGEYDQVVVVTDRRSYKRDKGIPPRQRFPEDFVPIDIVTVGDPIENLYFTNIELHHTGPNKKNLSVSANVAFSGQNPLESLVSLYEHIHGERRRKKLQQSTIQVMPEKTSKLVFSIPQTGVSHRSFSLQLSTIETTNRGLNNAIVEDDFAWIASASSSKRSVLLVSPIVSENALGLSSIPTLLFRQVSPHEFAQIDLGKLQSYSMVIFHRSAPGFVPRVPTMLVLPPENNPLFQLKGEEESPHITSWKSDSPLTTYLKIPLLRPGRSVLFKVPLWAQSILNVEHGSLIVAGDSHGLRFAAVGFEIFPFEGSKTPALSVLTLNLINWLTGGSELSRGFLAGADLRLDSDRSWLIQTPRGKSKRIILRPGKLNVFELEYPGIYSLIGTSVKANPRDKKIQRSIAVNSFYPTESSTFTTSYLSAPTQIAKTETLKHSNQPLWTYLLWIALGCLLIDILIYFLRPSSKAGAKGIRHA